MPRVYRTAECLHCKGNKPIAAKGVCRACYARQKKNGSLEYVRRFGRSSCHVDGCIKPVVSNGLCDMHRQRLKKHGNLEQTRPGDWGERTSHPLYKLWHGVLRRCEDPKHKDYVNYGARGIKVCERWKDFWTFLEDMGERPSPSHSIDRVDVNGDYSPDNCRWATPQTQGRNRRTSVLTQEMAAEIKRRARNGEKAGDISRSLSVHRDHVRHVLIGSSWRD